MIVKCQEINSLMMQKNNEECWECAVGSGYSSILSFSARGVGGKAEETACQVFALTLQQNTHEINLFQTPHCILTVSVMLSLPPFAVGDDLYSS